MKLALVAVMTAGLAYGQEAQDGPKAEGKKPDAVKAVRDDVAKALKATAAKGGFELEGSAETEMTQDMGMEMPGGFFGGMNGKISGAVTTPFSAAIKVKADKALYELVHDGKKSAERLTWRGAGQTPGDAANDVLSMLDFAKLAEAVGRAKAGKAHAEEKVGETACKVASLTLDGEAISKYLETGEAQEGMMMDFGMKSSKIELKVWIGAEDGLVRKLRAVVTKTMDIGIMPAEDGEEEEEGEEGEGQEMMTATYTVSLSKFGAAKVEIPEGMKELMKD